MKLFRIYQSVNNNYDTYDSAVVCAESEDDAKSIRPDDATTIEKPEDQDYWGNAVWCLRKDVRCEYIGEAKPELKRGVVCASFNAG